MWGQNPISHFFAHRSFHPRKPGVTTDVCVHTTMRHANDLGYECCLIEDGCAATLQSNHDAAIQMIKMQGGVFGTVVTSQQLIDAINSKF